MRLRLDRSFRKTMTDLRNRLIELRQLEEAAKLEFDRAKNVLLKIKREIRRLENILEPGIN